MTRSRVDLPEPDGPMTTVTSPGWTDEVDAGEHLERAVGLVHAVHLDQARRSSVAPRPEQVAGAERRTRAA